MQSRALACVILNRVQTQARSLNQVLETELADQTGSRDGAFIRDLCYGVMRWYPRLDFILQTLLDKPIRKKDINLKNLCRIGLYQIAYQRTPDHGAVSATVQACNELAMPWARGLVNAVLRNFIRKKQALLQLTEGDDEARYAHPGWLIDLIRQDWPAHWQDILEANNQQAPMILRTNAVRTSRAELLEYINRAGLACHTADHCEQGLILDKAAEIHEIPGFEQGLFSVQDGAAQQAVPLLDLADGQRVLDACAAPGGKTCHILESAPRLREVVAIDVQPQRLARITDNLKRLGLTATTLNADMTEPGQWWDGDCFERVLLDAPCTASGVIRRHPDIKYLRAPADIARINSLQHKLLDSVWPLLAPGGKLVYVTCSVLRRENDETIGRFLQRTPTAVPEPIRASWGEATRFGRQILPGQHEFDGFYFARLVKDGENA